MLLINSFGDWNSNYFYLILIFNSPFLYYVFWKCDFIFFFDFRPIFFCDLKLMWLRNYSQAQSNFYCRNAKDRLRGYFRFSNRKLRACGQHHRHSGDVDSEAINRVCSCDTGDAGSVVSYVHKSSNASSCQVEQLYAGSWCHQ